jgi:hypothetical protein
VFVIHEGDGRRIVVAPDDDGEFRISVQLERARGDWWTDIEQTAPLPPDAIGKLVGFIARGRPIDALVTCATWAATSGAKAGPGAVSIAALRADAAAALQALPSLLDVAEAVVLEHEAKIRAADLAHRAAMSDAATDEAAYEAAGLALGASVRATLELRRRAAGFVA